MCGRIRSMMRKQLSFKEQKEQWLAFMERRKTCTHKGTGTWMCSRGGVHCNYCGEYLRSEVDFRCWKCGKTEDITFIAGPPPQFACKECGWPPVIRIGRSPG